MSDEGRTNPTVPAEIRRLLSAVRRRLWFDRLLAGIHDCLVVALVLVLLLVVAAKLTPVVDPVWWMVFSGLGGLVLIGSLLLAARGRLSDSALAALADERLELRDRLSTALHCTGREDPFARAALEDGLDVARDPATRRRLAAAFAPRAPGGSWVAPLVGVVALLLWVTVPAGDVFATTDPDARQAADEERRDAEETVRAVLEEIEENSALSEQLGDITNNFALDESRPDGELDGEDSRREALRRVSELERRLDEIVNGEQGKQMDAMERALSEMEPDDNAATRELSEAMRRGDFAEAREALEELQRKLESSELSESDREALSEALESMAKKLEEAAKNTEALEDALRRAGLDPALAGNQQALEQALKQASGLNEQQLEQLKQMAAAQQSASQSCQNMSDAMSQLAKQARNGSPSEGGQQMQQMLSDAEQMKQMLMQAQSAKGQCQGGGQNGEGQSVAEMLASLPTKPQNSGGQNPPGRGFGPNANGGGSGNAPIKETKFATRLQKEQVALQEGGDVISRQLVESDSPVVGESTVELQATAERIIEGWEEGARDEVVPAHRREGVRGYLGELTRRIRANRRSSSTAPAPAAGDGEEAPAAPATDPVETTPSE